MAETNLEEINPIFLEMIGGDTPVLVQFHAVWCAPCKMVAPVVDALSVELENSLKVLKVDIDKNQPITKYLDITSVPTLMVFKKGEILWHHAGLISPIELKKVLVSVI